MSKLNVTVTVTGVINNIVQCAYVPSGPYTISKSNQSIIFKLDPNSTANGWEYTGQLNVTSGPSGQLKISGGGSSVTVTDSNGEKGTITYGLGLSFYQSSQVWSDPQNVNTGEG